MLVSSRCVAGLPFTLWRFAAGERGAAPENIVKTDLI